VVQFCIDAGDPARPVRDDADVVFDQDDRDPRLVERLEQLVERVAGLGVDADGRFVERQQVGLGGQRACDVCPLALTAGELVDLPVCEVGNGDRLEGLVDGRVILVGQSAMARVGEPAHRDGFADGDRHRAAAVGRLLGDVADPLAVVEGVDGFAK